MQSRRERRAAALEAIAHALLELAAVEREPEEQTPNEVLIDRRNCEKELGLTPRAFAAAAGRDFPAFRVSKRITATKADVLAWLKTRTVEGTPSRPVATKTKVPDADALLKAAHRRFVARVGRPMTDQELSDADMWIMAGKTLAAHTGRAYADTPDEIAARIESKIGKEPDRYKEWRSLGVDPAAMERDAAELREKLYADHPQWGWRERQRAVEDMWGAITNPLYEARRKARAEARAAKKLERAKRGQLGLKK